MKNILSKKKPHLQDLELHNLQSSLSGLRLFTPGTVQGGDGRKNYIFTFLFIC